MFCKKLLSALVLVSVSLTFTANALPIIGLDMDPSTPGIQSSLSVTEGALPLSLTIDLVAYNDDSTTPISVDTVNVGLGISSPGLVSFGGATAGEFAAGALDIFAPFGPLSDGSALTSSLAWLPLPFAGVGEIGMYSFTNLGLAKLLSVSLLGSELVADTFNKLMSFTFDVDVLTAGNITFSPLGDPPGSELLYVFAPPVPPSATAGSLFPSIFAGTLNIMSASPPPPPPTGVPEPSSLALLALGIIGLLRKRVFVK